MERGGAGGGHVVLVLSEDGRGISCDIDVKEKWGGGMLAV